MADTPRTNSGVGAMLDAAVDAETARLRLAKRAFDEVDVPEAFGTVAKAGAKGGGKLSRSETVTVRLDPKLRYLAELGARLHRRTLSSYIEWSIKETLDSEALRNYEGMRDTIGTEAEYLWDVDEADRFAKLALRYPHLLTHEEQVRWKLIKECPGVWRGRYVGDPETWTWKVAEDTLSFDNLRKHWGSLCAVADGVAAVETLPAWLMNKVKPADYSAPKVNTSASLAKAGIAKPSLPSTGFEDMDDDIPF